MEVNHRRLADRIRHYLIIFILTHPMEPSHRRLADQVRRNSNVFILFPPVLVPPTGLCCRRSADRVRRMLTNTHLAPVLPAEPSRRRLTDRVRRLMTASRSRRSTIAGSPSRCIDLQPLRQCHTSPTSMPSSSGGGVMRRALRLHRPLVLTPVLPRAPPATRLPRPRCRRGTRCLSRRQPRLRAAHPPLTSTPLLRF